MLAVGFHKKGHQQPRHTVYYPIYPRMLSTTQYQTRIILSLPPTNGWSNRMH
jgi:hypothetical protein